MFIKKQITLFSLLILCVSGLHAADTSEHTSLTIPRFTLSEEGRHACLLVFNDGKLLQLANSTSCDKTEQLLAKRLTHSHDEIMPHVQKTWDEQIVTPEACRAWKRAYKRRNLAQWRDTMLEQLLLVINKNASAHISNDLAQHLFDHDKNRDLSPLKSCGVERHFITALLQMPYDTCRQLLRTRKIYSLPAFDGDTPATPLPPFLSDCGKTEYIHALTFFANQTKHIKKESHQYPFHTIVASAAKNDGVDRDEQSAHLAWYDLIEKSMGEKWQQACATGRPEVWMNAVLEQIPCQMNMNKQSRTKIKHNDFVNLFNFTYWLMDPSKITALLKLNKHLQYNSYSGLDERDTRNVCCMFLLANKPFDVMRTLMNVKHSTAEQAQSSDIGKQLATEIQREKDKAEVETLEQEQLALDHHIQSLKNNKKIIEEAQARATQEEALRKSEALDESIKEHEARITELQQELLALEIRQDNIAFIKRKAQEAQATQKDELS